MMEGFKRFLASIVCHLPGADEAMQPDPNQSTFHCR